MAAAQKHPTGPGHISLPTINHPGPGGKAHGHFFHSILHGMELLLSSVLSGVATGQGTWRSQQLASPALKSTLSGHQHKSNPMGIVAQVLHTPPGSQQSLPKLRAVVAESWLGESSDGAEVPLQPVPQPSQRPD